MLFDATQKLFAETVRSYARDRLKPRYAGWEREPFSRSQVAELTAELGDLGVLGLLVPAARGGSGADFVAAGIASEELGRGDFNVTNFVQLSSIAALALGNWATPELADSWLPRIASGEVVPGLALTESSAGSDAAAITTTARRDGDRWVITGEKASMTFAGYADAAIVFARTGGPGASGISAFWVPLGDGVARQVIDTVGGKLTARGSIFLDEVSVPDDHLLGDEGTGFTQAMAAFDFNRAIIALGCIGAALESIEETVAYTSTRTTFGAPLSTRQAVTQQIAEHQSRLTAARLTAYHALQLADVGRPHTAEAAMAKWMGPSWAVDAIHTCLRLHGWVGYARDLPFDQRMRDVIGLEIGDGTAEIMKAIVARDLYGTATHR